MPGLRPPPTTTSSPARRSTRPSPAPGTPLLGRAPRLARPPWSGCPTATPATGSPANAGCCRCSTSSATAGLCRRRPAVPIGLDETERTTRSRHRWPGRDARSTSSAARRPLDTRTRASPAPPSAPQAWSRSCLNRSDHAPVGIVSNGHAAAAARRLRLTRQAYVEFDLEAIFDGELYADFRCCSCRPRQPFAPASTKAAAGRPRPDEDAGAGRRLETAGSSSGAPPPSTPAPARSTGLRDGVEERSQHLGTGFLAHPANAALRETLRRRDRRRPRHSTGPAAPRLPAARPVRRRGPRPAHSPDADPDSPRALRATTSPPPGCAGWPPTPHRRAATPTSGRRPRRHRRPRPATASPRSACPRSAASVRPATRPSILDGAELPNRDLLAAVRALSRSTTRSPGCPRPVDYRNLGSRGTRQHLESLLELHPALRRRRADVRARHAAGNERKTTGSYYTPSSSSRCLLDSALDPVLDEAVRARPIPKQALLALTVCRPGLRQRALPRRRRPPHRRAWPRSAPARRAHPRRTAGRLRRRHRPLHLRRRPQRWPSSSPR